MTEQTTSTNNTDKMSIWNAVCKTDPKYTKPVQNGTRTFTTVNSSYQIEQATELFGPYGSAWGLRKIERDFATLKEYELAIFTALFFYPGGEFEISTSMPIWISKPKGKLDNDILKKSETDMLSKSLSKLGFAADVFQGRYDDNRYIEEITAEFNKPEMISQPKQQEIVELIQSAGLTVDYFLQSWKLGHLSELWAENVGKAVKWITNHKQQDEAVQETVQTKEVINFHGQHKTRSDAKTAMFRDQEARRKKVTSNDAVQESVDRVKKALTPEEIKNVRNSLEFAGIDENAFCQWVGVKYLGQIESARYDGVMDYLFSKVSEKSQQQPKQQRRQPTRQEQDADMFRAMADYDNQRFAA